MADTAPTLSWSVHEFEKKDRHPDWHWYIGLAFALGAAVAIFYKDIFFGIFLLVAGAVVIIYAFRDPKLLTISFEEKGIAISDEFTPYDRIIQFWLDETSKPDKLLLRVQGSFVPVIALPLEGVDADAIRAAFKDKVPEAFIQESNSAKIFDRIGF